MSTQSTTRHPAASHSSSSTRRHCWAARRWCHGCLATCLCVSLLAGRCESAVESLRGFPAAQSSTQIINDVSWVASYALDDRTGEPMARTTDTGTTSPWWYVDLGVKSQVVYSIEMLGHNSDCQYQLLSATCGCTACTGTFPDEGLVIGVTDTVVATSEGSTWSGTVCKHITDASDLPAWDAKFVIACPAGARGRYVYVQALGAGRVLSLRSVEVDLGSFVQGPVLLTGKTATQSGDISSTSVASNAISGLPAYEQKDAHTACGLNDWWQVDLGAEYDVYNVMLVHRNVLFSDCAYRLVTGACTPVGESEEFPDQGTTVGVSNSPCSGTDVCGGTVCKKITGIASSGFNLVTGVVPVPCPAGTRGRYIYVQQMGASRCVHFKQILAGMSEKATCGCLSNLGFNVERTS